MGKCQAVTGDSKGVDSGLSQLGQMLGQLMGQLMKGGGGGGGGGGTPPSTSPTTGCVSGIMFQTSDPSRLSDPCAQYVASALPNSIPVATSSACDTLSSLLGSCSTGGSLTVSPTSGPAPLTVGFAATQGVTVDPGDGGSPVALSNQVGTYTYNIAGTYTATLLNASSTSIGTASVTVTPYVAGQTTNNNELVSSVFSATGTAGIAGLGNPLLLAPGSLSSGPAGDILFSGNGVTIFGSSLNPTNNTGVAGFFGSNTFNSQPQDLAAQLCHARPWASGFWGSVLPVSFFDNLCTWRGYQVGNPVAPAPTTPVVQLKQTPPAPKSAATTHATTTPALPSSVQIWAVPASVPLGTRTSIFWNTQGVTQCTETSPDGSFNQNSLSGGSATVPLTGATTFSISCLDSNGDPVTGYVTVDLSI